MKPKGKLLNKGQFSIIFRATAWIQRFINNCSSIEKTTWEVSSKEIQKAEEFWIQRAQTVQTESDKLKEIVKRSQLTANNKGI